MPVTCPGAPQWADFDDGATEKWRPDSNSSANRQDLVGQLFHIRGSAPPTVTPRRSMAARRPRPSDWWVRCSSYYNDVRNPAIWTTGISTADGLDLLGGVRAMVRYGSVGRQKVCRRVRRLPIGAIVGREPRSWQLARPSPRCRAMLATRPAIPGCWQMRAVSEFSSHSCLSASQWAADSLQGPSCQRRSQDDNAD